MTFSRRKKVIAAILSIVIWGLGHAYIGRIKLGILIFLIGLAIAFLIPFPFSLFVGSAYLAWLIYDLLRIVSGANKQSPSFGKIESFDSEFRPQKISCSKCGNINPEDSAFYVKCGSALK